MALPPGQTDGISPGAEPGEVRHLGIAPQCLHRQDHRQLDQRRPPSEPEPAVHRPDPEGQPRRADEKDDIAVLEQDRPAERVTQRTQGRARHARPPGSQQDQHPREGQRRVRDDVEPRPPVVAEQGVEDLAGIEYGGRGAAQQRHPAVLLGLPERPATGLPLGLDPPVERIVEVRGVAVGELLAAEQGPAVACGDQRQEAAQDEDRREASAHRGGIPDPRAGTRTRCLKSRPARVDRLHPITRAVGGFTPDRRRVM
jgi:hypothetical protein